MVQTKRCGKCGQTKATSEFYKQRSRKDGLAWHCKDCAREKVRQCYERNRKKYVATARRWKHTHRDAYHAIVRRYWEGHPEKERIKDRIKKHRRRSRLRNLPHTFTEGDWLVTLEAFAHSCAYCAASDIKLQQDHFVPLSKGGAYVVENIVPACKSCNSSKRDKDVAEWLDNQPLYCAIKAILESLEGLNADAGALCATPSAPYPMLRSEGRGRCFMNDR